MTKIKPEITKVIEDYPFIFVYYKSGVTRKYPTLWDTPQTVKDYMLATESTREYDGALIYGGNKNV